MTGTSVRFGSLPLLTIGVNCGSLVWKEPEIVEPGDPPSTVSRLLPERPGVTKLIPNPPRIVVLPSPNHGTCHAKPTVGAKFFHAGGSAVLSGFGVLGPTNSLDVR